jgi:hypothetical protein
MKVNFRLLRERCRVGSYPGTGHLLQVVYGLDHPFPSGSRKVLAPELTESLAKQNIHLFALDLYDEMIRIQLPLSANAKVVERSLALAIASLPEASTVEASREDQQSLDRYFKESDH